MKKLSEVCKTVGVTRRTLQEYDKIGLFSPTSKTDNGYWLYDDDAIKKLVLIQVFIEAGYERKKIKAILNKKYNFYKVLTTSLITFNIHKQNYLVQLVLCL